MTDGTPLRAVLAVISIALMGALALTTTAAARAAEDDGNVAVTIVEPSASPAPSSSSNGAAVPSTGTRSNSNGTSSQGDTVPPATAPTTSPADESTTDSIQVSGIAATPWSEPNPLGGGLRATIGITNHSSEVFDGELTFQLTTPLGTPIGPAVTREVQLQPGQMRERTASLPGLAQWPLVLVSAELTSTAESDELAPIKRDAWIFAFPWLLVAVVVAGAGAYILVRRARDRLSAAPEPASSSP